MTKLNDEQKEMVKELIKANLLYFNVEIKQHMHKDTEYTELLLQKFIKQIESLEQALGLNDQMNIGLNDASASADGGEG